MKKRINLIGIGTDGSRSLTQEAREQIQKSTVLIGAKRMLQSVEPIRKKEARCYASYCSEEIMVILEQAKEEEISVLFSGDPGFYSGAKQLTKSLEESGWEIRVIPGISSVICMAARCQVPWERAALVSLHGTGQNAVYEICTHEHTFLLLGGKETAERFLEKMSWYGLDYLEAAAGRELSYEEEVFFHGTIRELTPELLSGLSVLWVHNPDYDTSVGRHLKDEDLIRGKVPMTKSAVRAMAVAVLKLQKATVLYDIGAGTGSVSIEAALQHGSIRVYAVERNPEGIALIRENKRKWRTDQVEIVEGSAPEVLSDLPAPTHVFIGGSGNRLKEIVEICLSKNPSVRIVLTAVSMETIREMTELLQDSRWETAEVMQIQASGSRKMGAYHLMTAQNPVWMAVFQGRKEENHE